MSAPTELSESSSATSSGLREGPAPAPETIAFHRLVSAVLGASSSLSCAVLGASSPSWPDFDPEWCWKPKPEIGAIVVTGSSFTSFMSDTSLTCSSRPCPWFFFFTVVFFSLPNDVDTVDEIVNLSLISANFFCRSSPDMDRSLMTALISSALCRSVDILSRRNVADEARGGVISSPPMMGSVWVDTDEEAMISLVGLDTDEEETIVSVCVDVEVCTTRACSWYSFPWLLINGIHLNIAKSNISLCSFCWRDCISMLSLWWIASNSNSRFSPRCCWLNHSQSFFCLCNKRWYSCACRLCSWRCFCSSNWEISE